MKKNESCILNSELCTSVKLKNKSNYFPFANSYKKNYKRLYLCYPCRDFDRITCHVMTKMIKKIITLRK